MTERQLQDAVVECAQTLGWLVYHTHDSRRSQPGFPDLCMVRRGRLLFAELKSAVGKLRPDQELWVTALHGATGAEVFVWTPARWLDGTVEQVLR